MLTQAEKREFISSAYQRRSSVLNIDDSGTYRCSDELGDWGVLFEVPEVKVSWEKTALILQRRFLEPLVFNGYYIGRNSERALLIWYPFVNDITENDIEEVMDAMIDLAG